jgi:dTDP-glucose pyrophosphorylase
MALVYRKKDALLFMDVVTGSVKSILDSPSSDAAWIVAYSGISRELTKSGFNVRVAECHEAASLLKDGTHILGDVPRELFEEKKDSLPENLRKRATHFFTETERVRQGAELWKEAKLDEFGQLMNQSCASSINNYQSGSEILIELHELVSETNGIYGSRFSGGGYGGCVVALAKKDQAENACQEIAEKFAVRHPELRSKVFVAEMGDGISPSSPTLPPLGEGSEESPSPREASPKGTSGRGPRSEGGIASTILLAAGRGKRQRPYTNVTPKPLLEVNGRATLDYVLTAVAKAGVERVCIVTNHLEEQIFDYVGDGSRWNLSASFAHQSELRGNGDALLSVSKDWIRDEPVMVVATDYILEENSLLELVQAHKLHNADITMSLKECPIEELSARSSVDVDANWQVKRIIEKPTRNEIMSPYAASILFIFPPAIWKYLPEVKASERGEIEMQSAVQKMIEDGYKAFGVLQPAPQEWSPE